MPKTGIGFLAAFAAAGLLAWDVQGGAERVVLTPEPGFSITWDGNNGGFSNPEAGAGPSNNVALASNGTVAFGSSEFGAGVHLIAHANDGLYGNSHSWIADFALPDPDPFIGLSFAESVDVSSIAWGRDNGDTVSDPCGAGTCMDRNIGVYTLQFTQVAAPDAATPDTGDAATGWATLGTIEYLGGADDADFVGYLRHRFDVGEAGNPIQATGLRIRVSDVGTAIDEIEVNPIPDPVPPIDLYFAADSEPGFSISWDGNEGNFSDPSSPAFAPENAARLGTAFGSSEFGSGHLIANVNDGRYGNLASWIANFGLPDPDPFIGINFGACIPVRSIAWSRDNGDGVDNCCGGTATDRTLGIYTLQITARTDADASTPETGDALSGWQTVGTVDYKGNDPVLFTSHLRHRFDVSAGGGPVLAAAIRIKVPNAGIAIDEIEVNVNQVIEQELLAVAGSPGFDITWDGNQGDFQDPRAGAAPPSNQALAAMGTVAFGSSEFGAGGVHLIANVNDGLYDNAHSWLSDFTLPDLDPYIALNFGASIAITNLAWSRDNGDDLSGVFTDRSDGIYTIQITDVPNPDATTLETDDAATGWQTIGTVTYAASMAPDWQTHLRHRFEVGSFGGPIFATGLRIKPPNNGTAIDEIEVNTGVVPPPPPDPVLPVVLTPELSFEMGYDGNDGDFEDPRVGASAPHNRALASEGTVPFASSELADFGHLIAELNDGLYGNLYSWISGPGLGTDPDPFVGLDFGGMISITNIAWGRDNGDNVDNCCGGIVMDRSIDLYTLQFTQVPAPGVDTVQTDDASTGWATIGTVDIRGNLAPLFHSWLRHRFELSQGGAPIEATGIRIRMASNATAIDEIEINTAGPVEPAVFVDRTESNIVVTWVGDGVLEGATSVNGPWFECLITSAGRYSAPIQPGEERYFRLRVE